MRAALVIAACLLPAPAFGIALDISGTVRDISGQPVAGVQVTPKGAGSPAVFTSDSGAFRFVGDVGIIVKPDARVAGPRVEIGMDGSGSIILRSDRSADASLTITNMSGSSVFAARGVACRPGPTVLGRVGPGALSAGVYCAAVRFGGHRWVTTLLVTNRGMPRFGFSSDGRGAAGGSSLAKALATNAVLTLQKSSYLARDYSPDTATETNVELTLYPDAPQWKVLLQLEYAHDAFVHGKSPIQLDTSGNVFLTQSTQGSVSRYQVIDNGQTVSTEVDSPSVAMRYEDQDGDGIFEIMAVVVHGQAPDSQYMQVIYDSSGTGLTPTYRMTRRANPDDSTLAHTTVEVLDTTTGQLYVDYEYDSPVYQQSRALPKASRASANSPPYQIGTGCSSPEAGRIRAAFAGAFSQGLACLRDMGKRSVANALNEVLMRRGITFSCYNNPASPEVAANNSIAPVQNWLDRTIEISINVGRPEFSGGDFNRYVFHELEHSLGSEFPDHYQAGDPANNGSLRTGYESTDATYACASFCFDATKTQCMCKRCKMGTAWGNGTSREGAAGSGACLECSKYAACTDAPRARCQCGANAGKLFVTPQDCAVDCPTGLLCFTARCKTWEPNCP
jgi:hypothetical protein